MQLVIFDCDGTLVDSQHAIYAAMEHAFARVGLPAPSHAEVVRIIGLSVPQAVAALARGEPAAVQREIAHGFRTAYPEIKDRIGARDPLFPGARQAIEALAAKGDLALGIATGKSRRGVDRLLDQEGWRGRFATIQTADDHPSKPHPSMILQAMAETMIEPARTLIVGDTTFDMLMGLNAGVGAIGVGWGYHAAAELEAAGAHAIVAAFDDLAAAIDRLLAREEASHER